MAEVKPFRAVRYGVPAGPLEALVAPPYDVITAEQRDELRACSPHNVVHLTLPDDEAEAGRLWSDWRAEGVLARSRRLWRRRTTSLRPSSATSSGRDDVV